MPKANGRRKKTRTHKVEEEEEELPKSFVFKKGKIGVYLRELVQDFRNVMYPFTALKLKDAAGKKTKDYLTAAGILGVSHFVTYSQTENGNYLKLIKTPKGPTLTFRIEEYALARDVIKFSQETKKNSKIFDTTLQTAPLLIMNGFKNTDSNDPSQIVNLMVQSMFPSLKVDSLNLSTCKRLVLFSQDEENHTIEFRHYAVSARQRSVNKSLKKLVNNQKVPNLAGYYDLSDYFLKGKRAA